MLMILVDITERKQGESALGKRVAQLALLSDVGSQIAAVLAVDEVLKQAACLVQQYFGYHHVGVFVLDRQRNMLIMRARAGDFTQLFPDNHALELNQGIVGWVGAHGQSLLANDVDGEPRYVNLYPDVVPTRSELSVPIRMGHNILGVLDVQSPKNDAFDENDVMVMETLAGQIAVALENAHLYQSVQQELHERMQAEQELRVERDRAQRYLDIASVILVAIDGYGMITLMNRKGHEILQYAEGELLGQNWFDTCLPAVVRESVRTTFLQLMCGDAVAASYYENAVITKTGEERLIAWHNTLIHDDAAKIIGTLSSGEDITQRRRAEGQIKASLAEKEVLLREIHHRVKNNMQVMISLLNLQANQLPDSQTRAALLESQNRIRSMALVHESLYQSANLSQVNFQDYLYKLLSYLQTVYVIKPSIRLNLESEPISLSVDQAIPCGLIVSEMVSNAIKHAFPGERSGTVTVHLNKVEQRNRLTVSDDGIGIPADLDIYHTSSLGMQLITILTNQLDGELELVRQGGTTFQITF
jgi:PAS domain S-box-containing protein